MVEPISLAVTTGIVVTYLTKNALSWLESIRGALFDKGKEFIVEKGTGYGRNRLHLDEKEQQRHLELVLKNAVERGLKTFQDA